MTELNRKDEQLGMSHSTASARLKKELMLSMAKKLGMDTCFRCGDPILMASELSVDHKLPWLGVSNELFWDIDNLAFSHAACNSLDAARRNDMVSASAASVRARTRKGKGPEGTSWCSGHKKYLPVEQFAADSRTKDGFRYYCRECEKKSAQASYQNNLADRQRKYREHYHKKKALSSSG